MSQLPAKVGKVVGKDKEDLSRQAATIMQTGTFAPEDLLREIVKLERQRAAGEGRA